MADSYQAQRQKNIEANKALLMSLGLEQLQNFAPAAVSKPAAPKPKLKVAAQTKAKPKAKQSALKRKREEEEDFREEETKAARLEGEDGDDGRRRSTRRSGKPVTYNEEELVKKKEKAASDAKLRTQELGEDSTGRVGNRLGQRKHSPKQFGAIPGVEVGTWWETRAECSTDAIHAPFVAGISGDARLGAYSVALSGGYDDDVDLGYAFTYTGSGGRDLKGTKLAPKNLRTAPQSCDQTFDNPMNMSLKVSSQTKKPVRVIRGYKLPSIYAPKSGYRYDGLYIVEKAWSEAGLNPKGYKVVKFAFKRLPNQPPLPERSLNEEDEDEEEEEEEGGESDKGTSPPGSPSEVNDDETDAA